MARMRGSWPPGPARNDRRPDHILLAACLLTALLAALAVPTASNVQSLVADTVPGGPLAPLAFTIATQGLWVLVGTAAVLAVSLVVTRRWAQLAHLGAGALAACLAYASSELLKLLFAAPRPCHGRAVPTALSCPPVGDWSWPSNHAVIATAIAAAIFVAGGNLLGVAAAAAASLIALARVAVGVHHLHDTFSGMALALLWAWVANVALTSVRTRLAVRKEPSR